MSGSPAASRGSGANRTYWKTNGKRRITNMSGEWISVKEQCPADDLMVLVWSQSNGLHLAYLDSYRQWRDADDNPGKKITHWMPLPAPPTDDK